jgi:uncharacterized SAM-binding protein YcdF (DUF218 family)
MARHLVILGTRVLPDGRPSSQLAARIEAALRLARTEPAAKLILTGRGSGAHTEAAVMQKQLLAGGIAPERLYLDEAASNTRENAEGTQRLLQAMGEAAPALMLITHTAHLQRALRIFRGMGFDEIEGHAVAYASPTEAIIAHFYELLALLKPRNR